MSALHRALRLGFAGTPEFAVPALNALLHSRHSIHAVFTQPDRPAGRGQALHVSAVKQRALDAGLPVHQPVSLKTPEAAALLRSLTLDALVVVAYGLLLPSAVLAAPALGCFNIHGSLLPRWRGAAPIQRALLAGDAVTGVTIMRMEAGLDTGPLLERREIVIGFQDTAGSLHDRLAVLGGELMVAVLDAIADGGMPETAQPSEGVTYAEKLTKGEAQIEWRDDAVQVLRKVRAFNPWPVAETRLAGAQLRIWNAEVAPHESNTPASAIDVPVPGTVLAATAAGIDVVCGSGVLRITRLQLAGRKALPAQEFIKAQPLAGARFARE